MPKVVIIVGIMLLRVPVTDLNVPTIICPILFSFISTCKFSDVFRKSARYSAKVVFFFKLSQSIGLFSRFSVPKIEENADKYFYASVFYFASAV